MKDNLVNLLETIVLHFPSDTDLVYCVKLNIIFQCCQTRCQRTTQEDFPRAEDAREVEEEEEAMEDVAEPNISPINRTTLPPSSRETVRTYKDTHLTLVTTSKQRSMCRRLIGSLNTWEQNKSMAVTFTAHLRMKCVSQYHIR